MILRNSIEKLIRHENLDTFSCREVFKEILTPETNPLHIAAFLVLLRTKTETVEELTNFAIALQEKMVTVSTDHQVLDIVGTGGDGTNTINISTGSAILAASCGIKIAKHGNRAVSSLAGSADVLEALGVNINLSPEKISASIHEIGIGFCYSPNFHPAMRELRTLRQQLNLPTTFNLLGPLLNPTHPQYYLLGVFSESLLPLIAATLKQMGTKRSFVVHGGGLDEISCVAPTKLIEVTQKEMKEHIIDPKQLNLAYCNLADLKGGNAKTNAQILLTVLSGKYVKQYQAITDTFLLNTALALYLYGLHSSITDALAHARENLHQGLALILLKNWIEFSHDE